MTSQAKVAVLMGSKSDWPIMKECVDQLASLGIDSEARVISAHRTPERHHAFVTGAEEAGIRAFICGAGMAAHLAGVTAALTPLPVIGVPLKGGHGDGLDALLSTVQMPAGIPVATVAIGKHGAKNAAILAAQMLSLADPALADRIKALRAAMSAAVPEFPDAD